MSIQPITLDNAAGAVKETLQAVKQKLGMVPNLFGVLAKAPKTLDSYLAVSENLKGGELSVQIAEQVAIALANANSCEYCLSAHTAIGKMVGVDGADLEAAQSGSASDAKAQAAINLALELNQNKGHGDATQKRAQEARDAGLSDAEILEIAAHVALNTLTNSVNGIAQTVVDFPKVSLSRKAA